MPGPRMSRSRIALGATAALGVIALAAAGVATGSAQAAPAGAAVPAAAAAATHRVLFDNTKAETAGNADWIISTSQPDPLGQDSTPNAETDWTGALSSWGVALQKAGGYSLNTLPSGRTITYGNSSNAQDLSNFDTFVLTEPNVKLSAAEKTAVMTFVKNGGGLFLISDHNNSDRNNDGCDSPCVINDLLTSNGVDNTDPFGFSVDLLDISTDNPRAISSSSDPVLHGPFGTVTGSILRDGTTFTLKPADNPNVKGLLYHTGSSGNSGAFFVTSTFGSGRVAIWGDSSPADDGTGQSGNTLYDGWNDPAGTDAALALNATAWLSGSGSTTPPTTPPTGGTTGGGGSCTGGQLLANPGFESGASSWSASSGVINNSSGEPAHAGSYKAWLDGYGTATTDTVSQSVTIPSGCSARLSFWLHIDTAETGSTAYDTLKVQVLNSSGTVLSTPATYSNANAASGWTQRTFDLSAYAGQTITLKFTGTEGSKLQTSFVIDDVAITIS
ncbi:choice-of-anchor J domain-containing protein [Streptomyces sp. NBC_01477]|uniref:choice-of-anchor J domain-containing protein n=1 Tax=Streptomyces sp. NBC_01477 TaxID=2976015 RepID=UPI002E2EE255|nr:choice-of-anchor J domain-containing protein [Streptomyces sp. NBC_01477]